MIRDKRGSSFVYVITMIALLVILSTGFLYMADFNTRTSESNYRYLQEIYLAKSIHRAVCQAAEEGNLEILKVILQDISERGSLAVLAGEAEVTELFELSEVPVQSELPETRYQASTGENTMELENGNLVTVQIDLTCDVGLEEDRDGSIDDGIQAVIDTYVWFPEGNFYQFSAVLFEENGKWKVVRHFETSTSDED